MSKNETIIGALGLNKSVIDRVMRDVMDSDSTRVSDDLELAGAKLRKELFGNTDSALSEYEKSLLMIGFFLGVQHEGSKDANEEMLAKAIEQVKKTFPDFDELSAPVEGDDCDCPACRLRRFEEKKGIKIGFRKK